MDKTITVTDEGIIQVFETQMVVTMQFSIPELKSQIANLDSQIEILTTKKDNLNQILNNDAVQEKII